MKLSAMHGPCTFILHKKKEHEIRLNQLLDDKFDETLPLDDSGYGTQIRNFMVEFPSLVSIFINRKIKPCQCCIKCF